MKTASSKLTFLLSILLLLTAAFAATSCGGGEKTVNDTVLPSAVLTAIMAEFPEAPAGLTYTSEDDDLEYFSTILGATEFGDGFSFPELEVTESYAVFIPEAKTTFRAAIFKANTPADAEALKTMCQSKITATQNDSQIKAYDDEQGTMQTMANNAQIHTAGNYIILLITPDNPKAITAAESVLYQ